MYIYAPTKNFKVGGNFGAQTGLVHGHFDCKIHVKHSHEYLGIDLNCSHDSLSRVSIASCTNSGVDSLDTKVQGFVVRESLLDQTASPRRDPGPTASPWSHSSARGFWDQRWNGPDNATLGVVGVVFSG